MADPSQIPPASSPQPKEPTPPLNYLSPRRDPQREAEENTRAFFGGILTFLVLFVLVVIWVISRIKGIPMRPSATSPSTPPPSNLLPLMATFAGAALLAGIALFQYRRHNSTAFVKGILIGIGFFCCLAGLCFMIRGR